MRHVLLVLSANHRAVNADSKTGEKVKMPENLRKNIQNVSKLEDIFNL